MQLWQGRSIRDLDLDVERNVRPLSYLLAQYAAREFRMGTLYHNLALGAQWDVSHFKDKKEGDQYLQTVTKAGMKPDVAAGNYERPPHEKALLVLRNLYDALNKDSLPPMLVVFEFSENTIGDVQSLAPDVIFPLGEMISLLSGGYNIRRHKVLVLFCTEYPEALPERVLRSLPILRVANPNKGEKKSFIKALRDSSLRKTARYSPGLDDDTIANLASDTPNVSLESAFYASAKLGTPIKEQELLEQKKQDVLRLSQGMLSLTDTSRTRGIRLRGHMIEPPLKLLSLWGARLKAGDPRVPSNILLAGAPSGGKTDMAVSFGQAAGLNTFEIHSPKGCLVGETERRAALQWRLLKDFAPNIGVIDEITEAFPVSRSDANLDSGASSAVVAQLLTALSDVSRAGKSVLIATTNIPQRMGTALQSRFTVVPVLSAIREDYPGIIVSLVRVLDPKTTFTAEEPEIRQAADIFYEKGCMPRVIRAMLVSSLSLNNEPLSLGMILESAQNAFETTHRDRSSIEYADLFSIKLASDRRYLPWSATPESFPYPEYLKSIVRSRDGGIEFDRLNARLEELKPHIDL